VLLSDCESRGRPWLRALSRAGGFKLKCSQVPLHSTKWL